MHKIMKKGKEFAGNVSVTTANEIEFSKSGSNLSATNAQEAIEEICNCESIYLSNNTYINQLREEYDIIIAQKRSGVVIITATNIAVKEPVQPGEYLVLQTLPQNFIGFIGASAVLSKTDTGYIFLAVDSTGRLLIRNNSNKPLNPSTVLAGQLVYVTL